MAGSEINVVLAINDSKYSAAIERARAGIKRLQSDMKDAGASTVSSMQASSAAIRLVEGGIQNNIRATERFLSMIPGVGAALQAAFPIVGAVAFIGVLSRVGTSLKDAVDHARGLTAAINSGFRQLTSSSQLANDELALTNAKLGEQIAKLEHKPVNNLAVTLAEARVEADKLADSLLKDANAVNELMQKNHANMFDQLLGAGSDKAVVNQSKAYEAQLTNAGFAHAHDVAAFGPDSTQAKQSQQAITSLLDQIQRYAASEIAKRSGRGSFAMENGQQVFRSDPNGAVAYGKAFGDQTSNIALLQGLSQIAQQRQDNMGLETQHSALEKTLGGLQSQPDNSAAAAAEAAAKQREKWREQALEAYKKSEQDDREHIAEQNRLGEELLKSLQSTDAKQLAELQKKAQEEEKYQDQLADIARKGAAAQAMQGIEFARNAGQITQHAAALEMATLNTKAYQQALADLQKQQTAANGVGDAEEANRVGLQIAQLNAERGVQQQADQHNIDVTTVQFQLGELASSLQDTASQIRSIISQTLGSLNDAILNGKGFGTVGKQFMRNMGKSGLENVEGKAMDAMGIKHGKLGSNKSNPMYVNVVNPSGDSGSGSTSDTSSSGPMALLGKMLHIGGSGTSGNTGNTGQSGSSGNSGSPFVRGTFNSGIYDPNNPNSPYPSGGDSQQYDSNTSQNPNAGQAPPSIWSTLNNLMGTVNNDQNGTNSGGDNGSGGQNNGPSFLSGGNSSSSSDDSDDSNSGFSGMGFAAGGDPPVGQASVVGERGPELFVPKRAGTIVPNGKFGVTHIHNHDFSHGNWSHTDPHMVQAQIKAAAPQIAAAAVKSISEHKARTPPSRH